MVNSKYIYSLLVVVFSFLFCACEQEKINYSKMVVEGWIDAEKHPVVMLHTSYSLDATSDPYDTQLVEVLAEHMILFGKVVIFDGEDSITLTGRVDTNYLPPYIYTTTKIRGEVGKTYTIRATYKDFSAHSTTHIPYRATFDSIRVTEHNTQMNIVGYANNLKIGIPYIIMARTTDQRQYKICPMGAFRANNSNMAITINNPLNFTDENIMQQTLFPKKDSISIAIKFAEIGEEEYQFWNSFIAQNMTQGVFFMETHSNIISNIQNGNGYWCGMGSTEYIVKLNKTNLYIFDNQSIRN